MAMARLALAVTALAVSLYGTDSPRFDQTAMVVIGGGISAGFSGFKLTAERQAQAWPSLIAQQMGTILALPTMRESGHRVIVNSFQPLPGLLPAVPQSGERGLPFPLFAMNLSVPTLNLGGATRVRPQPAYEGLKMLPAIEGDLQRTLVNNILGGPLMVFDKPVLLTQVEYAEFLRPTLVFVERGFEDVLDAALTGETGRITSQASFTTDMTEVVRRMRRTAATVVVLTVPDPLDTAYFATVDDTAQALGRASSELQSRFGVTGRDVLTLGGMIEVSDAFRGRRSNTLSAGSVVPAAAASAISSAVSGYNSTIRSVATAEGALVIELADLIRQARAGIRAGTATVKGTYGAGFYSDDGLFPGPTGQAIIANAVLQAVNTKFGTAFAPVAVDAVARGDVYVSAEDAR
jgi:hypothetical protein